MKINKDAARAAKDLFRLSFVDGRLDEGRVKKIVKPKSTDTNSLHL